MLGTDVFGDVQLTALSVRLMSDVRWHERGIHITLLKALIESAMISWLATLSCAVIWSIRSNSDDQTTFVRLRTC
jgi:hypothetical protein